MQLVKCGNHLRINWRERLLEQGTRSTTNVALLNQSTSTSKTIGDGIFNISDRNRLGLMSSY
jgi:hypothetical protein